MTSIVKSTSVSYEAIRADLEEYVKSLENYNSNWKDFYEGGAGSTVIQLLSGLGAFLSHTAYVNRRESYLDTATLRTSTVALSTTLGYNVNRPTAPRLSLLINSSSNQFVQKTTSLGDYNGKVLSLLEDKTLLPGDNLVEVILGEWRAFNYTATDPKEFSHLLIPDIVDNNLYELLVNGNIVEIVRNAEELTPNNVLIRTFTYGIFLIWGDGVLGKSLELNDDVVFNYVNPTSALLENIVNTGDITLDISAQPAGVSILSYGTAEDSNNKLKAIASGYFSTKRRLITLSDYEYIGSSYNGIISAYARKQANTCCVIELAYITDSYRTLLPEEKLDYLAYLDTHKILGTSIILIDPTPISVDVNLTLVISSVANTQELTGRIRAYLESQTYKLGVVFSISGLFAVSLPDTLRVYIKSPIVDRKALFNQYFVLSALNITFSTNSQLIESNGTNPLLGYSE